MLATLLLPLLLVACAHAKSQFTPDIPQTAVQTMAVDTAGACNCVCVRTAEVSVAYQTKYNACSGRADRQRLCRNATGRGQDPKPPVHPPLRLRDIPG